MLSVNRRAIYCYFFGVAVNHRFFLSIQATKKGRISANMNTIYCHFPRPNEAEKKPFQAADKTNDPRRFAGDKRNGSRKCALLYRCPTCISRALRESLPAASECGRQAGGDNAFGVSTCIFPSVQGLRPLRRFADIP